MELIFSIYNKLIFFIKRMIDVLNGDYKENFWRNFNNTKSEFEENNNKGRVFVLYLFVFPSLAIAFFISYIIIFIVLSIMLCLSGIVLILFLFLVHPIVFFVFPYQFKPLPKKSIKTFSDKILAIAFAPILFIYSAYSNNMRMPFVLLKSENKEEKLKGILSIIAFIYMCIPASVITLILIILAGVFLVVMIIPYSLVFIAETFSSFLKSK